MRLSIICFLFPVFVVGQNTQYFNKILSNDTITMLSTCVLPIDSGYLVTGIYNPTPVGEQAPYTSAIFLQKLDSLGNEKAFYVLDSETPEEERQLLTPGRGSLFINCSDGNYLMVYTSAPSQDTVDRHLNYIKFDEFGETIFKKSIIEPTRKVIRSVIETSDKGFLMVGFNNIEPIITSHFYAVKTDSLGNIEWEITQPMGTQLSSAFTSIEDIDGGFVLGGFANYQETDFDIQLLKLDEEGNYVWEKHYDVNGWIDCAGIFAQHQGGYMISTCTNDPSIIGNNNIQYLLKLDQNFDLVWDKLFPPEENWYALDSDIIVNIDGSFVQSGRFNSIYGIPFIRKISSTGDIEWTWSETYDSSSVFFARDLEKTADGGYVMAAFQFTNWQRGWLVKIDSMGNTCSYVGCDSTVYALAEDTTDTIIDGLYFANSSSIQVYPNPATTSISFSYQIEKESILLLYNSLGQVIKEVPLIPYSNKKTIATDGFVEGIYYWHLGEANGKLVVRR